MASFSAFLEVGGSRYPLTYYDLYLHQQTDVLGRPASLTQGGTITCELHAPPQTDTVLTDWMLSPTRQYDGLVHLYREDTKAKLKTISFFNAYCVDMGVHFSATGSGPMLTSIVISPQRVAVGAVVHDNNWPVESHGAGITHTPPTPPKEPSAFSEGLHTLLDVVGMIPIVGELADGANALMYAAEGDYVNAAVSAASMIPLAGNVVGAAKLAKTGLKMAQKLKKFVPPRLVKGLEKTAFAGTKKCTKVGHPVDVATGLLFTAATDFDLPGPIPLVWERNWYSASDYNGPLGYGWSHAYDLGLALDTTTNTAVLRLADGRQVAFGPSTVPNQPVLDVESQLALHRPDPGQPAATPWLIWDKNQQVWYVFAPPVGDGAYQPLHTIENNHGQFIGFQYGADLRLQRITDSAGRQIQVQHTEKGQLLDLSVLIAGEPQLLVSYTYDEDGNLTGATNAEGHTMTYRYEQQRLVQETSPLGHSFYFEYELETVADKAPRCVHTWGDGDVFDTRLTYVDGQTTDVTDSYGQPSRYIHQRGLVVRKINALDYEELNYYDESQQLVASTNALRQTTHYRYDELGNLLSTQFADGTYQQTEYDIADHPISFIDARGSTWLYNYDEAGQLVVETDPLGAVTHYAYDEQGHIVTLTNALDQETHLRYDEQGNLAHIITPDEQIRSRGYDALGNLTSLTDPTGAVRQLTYDRLGQPTDVIEPDGTVRHITYDAGGNVVRVQYGEREVEMTYNGLNQMAVRRQAGLQIQFSYDKEGRLTSLTNEAGLHYRFELDATGQVSEEEGFDGIRRRFERDAVGQVTRIIRPADRSTEYGYTETGQVAQVRYSDGTQEVYGYNETGDLIKAQNNTVTVRLERDAVGQVICETQGDYRIDYAYNLLGQRTRLTSSLGANITLERDQMGNLSQMSAQNWQAQFGYDSQGLEIQRSLSGGIQTGWQRDALGRPTQQRISRGGTNRQRTYQWQTGDVLTQIDDTVSGISHYEYDLLGTLTRSSYGDGSQEVRLPDAVGNLFESSTKDDRQYGPGGQLLSSAQATYSYDAEGNLTQKTTRKGEVWQYDWLGNGLLANVLRPDGRVVTFTYDALGRRVSKAYKGKVNRWVWAGNKPLHEWAELTPNGQNTEDIITWLFEEDSFAPIGKIQGATRQSILTDHLGTPLEMIDHAGQRTWAAQTTAYGRVRLSEGTRAECPFRFQGQYEDVETGMYYNRFRYYDPEGGVYVSQDPISLLGGGRLYGYVSNPAAWLDVLGLMPFWKPLKPSGMGHHPIPRSHANQHGLPRLGTEYDSPSWFPDKVDGSDTLHKQLHDALKKEGIPFSRPFTGTQQELIDKVKKGYQGIGDKGFLKIPNTGEIIAKDITIAQAVDEQIKWNQLIPCKS